MDGSVVITGANGWIGGKLAHRLLARGVSVVGVSRTPDVARERLPQARWIAPDGALEEAVAASGRVVNLAGRHLLEQPLDDAFKEAVRASRLDLTQRIVEALRRSPAAETVLVSGSGYPVYGDRGEAVVDEDTPITRGGGFVQRLDADWEEAAAAAAVFGTRVVLARIGLVLGTDGGALPALRQSFDAGTGLVLGSGEQWLSWIHIDDAAALLDALLTDPAYRGPVNVVAPEPVRYRDFARALADQLGVPCEIVVPPEGVYGQMGEAAELVLASIRAEPRRASARGFPFEHPRLDKAIAACVAPKAGTR